MKLLFDFDAVKNSKHVVTIRDQRQQNRLTYSQAAS